MTDKPDPAADWWTTTEVAAYIGVSVATVSSYRGRGQMPAPDRTIGRTHVWQPRRIIAWQESRPRPGVGGRPPSPKVTQESLLLRGRSTKLDAIVGLAHMVEE